MHRLRSFVVVVGLSLFLGAAVASAAEAPARALRESGRSANILDQLGALLTLVWDRVGCKIDPWGGCATGDSATPSTDEGCHIDPWGGGCAPATPSTDTGCHIDPLGGRVSGQ